MTRDNDLTRKAVQLSYQKRSETPGTDLTVPLGAILLRVTQGKTLDEIGNDKEFTATKNSAQALTLVRRTLASLANDKP